MFDLTPATDELGRLLREIRDDQLDNPTPCEQLRVSALIDHLDTFAQAFTASATKTNPPRDEAPQPDGARIGADWRDRLPARLDALATAWREPAAWEGVSMAGPFEMPADAVARVALDEVIVHGWDLATATGQSYACADELAGAAMVFVQGFAEQNPQGAPGLFGPAVKVPGEAPLLHQLLGLTGRDPSSWSPASG
jgi:uncharacterized protein (TIGR03086 family)